MPLHALLKHLVGQVERRLEGGVGIGDAEQILVRNDDQAVDMPLQLLEPGIGGASAAGAFEGEGPGHDADGQDATGARRPGDDRRGAGAGAAAKSGGDEAHMGAVEDAIDLGEQFLGGRTAKLGARTRAEAFGRPAAELDDAIRARRSQRLRVGIGGDELDSANLVPDHVGHGVAAGTADADDTDARAKLFGS